MNSEDEKHQKMMKAVSVFYSDAANAESVFGRPVTDIERHIFRIGANLFRNIKNDTLPITGFIHSVAFDPILSECNGEDFCNDEFSMLAARNAAWHAIKSAIKKGELIIRDGLSMVPVNELPSVLNWCAADSPGLDQVSANFVVKTDEARRWLEASGMPIPEWMNHGGEPVKDKLATTTPGFPEPSKKTAPAAFSEPFEKVLCEIERVANDKRIQFDRKNAPCEYEDLQKFTLLMNSSFPEYPLPTFAKYARMCGVWRGTRGRPKKLRNNVLPELFPALYENQ